MSILPYHLHRAVQIVSLSGAADASDVQGALREIAARLVLLEETLNAVLTGEAGARDKAWRLLVEGDLWSAPDLGGQMAKPEAGVKSNPAMASPGSDLTVRGLPHCNAARSVARGWWVDDGGHDRKQKLVGMIGNFDPKLPVELDEVGNIGQDVPNDFDCRNPRGLQSRKLHPRPVRLAAPIGSMEVVVRHSWTDRACR